jgi:surface antigen
MKRQLALMAGLLALGGCAGGTAISSGGGGLGPAGSTGAAAATKAPAGQGAVAASIIGAMNGGLIGGPIGSDLDAAERREALEAEYRALEYTQSGQPVVWGSRQGGRYGEVVAASPYRVGSQDCRQYAQTVYTGGQPKRARGTACRNPDGGWTPLT